MYLKTPASKGQSFFSGGSPAVSGESVSEEPGGEVFGLGPRWLVRSHLGPAYAPSFGMAVEVASSGMQTDIESLGLGGCGRAAPKLLQVCEDGAGHVGQPFPVPEQVPDCLSSSKSWTFRAVTCSRLGLGLLLTE